MTLTNDSEYPRCKSRGLLDCNPEYVYGGAIFREFSDEELEAWYPYAEGAGSTEGCVLPGPRFPALFVEEFLESCENASKESEAPL